MRENIGLYRGKRIDNDEWVEGFLCKKYFHEAPNDRYVIQYKTVQDGKMWRPDYMVAEVDPETICQYTGLAVRGIYSAYGKKIFEGDILRFRYTGENRGVDGVAAVIFEGGKFGVKWGWHSELVALTGFANTSIEIIGNIHDNPELLEAADG